jgi:hypothetical protein
MKNRFKSIKIYEKEIKELQEKNNKTIKKQIKRYNGVLATAKIKLKPSYNSIDGGDIIPYESNELLYSTKEKIIKG